MASQHLEAGADSMWKKAFLGLLLLVIVAAGVVVFYSSGGDSSQQEVVATAAPPRTLARPNEPITPITTPSGLNAQKVILGQILFHDARLSRDGTISCATCHDLSRGGVDNLPRSFGVGGAEGEINTPTVYNSSLNFRQFWDGRALTLEEQAEGPILNPVEMAASWEHVLAVLRGDQNISERFRAVYGAAATKERVLEAIAEFERSLVTPSRFDRWLNGDDNAITAEELEGYNLFKRYGCATCHNGENVGGGIFQRFGVTLDYFAGREPTKADLGRFNVTGRVEDKHIFKVPGLRNVALTAPYFHDASAETLQEAVAIMGRYQLGMSLPDDDIKRIMLFLNSLTGEQL